MEDERREDREHSEEDERFMQAVNHFVGRRTRSAMNEERRHEGCAGHSKTESELLDGTDDRARLTRLSGGDVGVNQRVHARILV